MNEKLLRAVNASPAIRIWYKRQIDRLIDALKRSLTWWMTAKYKTGEASIIHKELEDLRAYWLGVFDISSERIADKFVRKIDRAVSSSVKNSLAEMSIRVTWKNSKEFRNVMQSLKDTQVALIKSIPEQELLRVSGILQRGLQNGQDLPAIKAELEKGFGITARRARLIAIDQTNKATFAINRQRMISAGVTEGIWIHVAGRKTSRPTHVAMHHKRFKLTGKDAGLFDSDVGRNVMPAECVYCRCKWRAIVKPKYS